MRPTLLLRCLAALSVALPAWALAAVTVATTLIQAPSGAVGAGSTLTVACQAEGGTSGDSLSASMTTIDRIDVTVSGGSVTPSQLTGAVRRTCSSGSGACSWLQGNVSWLTPPTPGTLSAVCTITYTNTTALGETSTGTAQSSASIATVATAERPPVITLLGGPGTALVGATAAFEVAASDPNAVQQPLTYEWRATAGTITPDPANPAAASWVAPQAPGSYDVTVKVSRGALAVEATRNLSVLVAEYQAGLPVTLRTPARVAAAEDGTVYVVDPGPEATGQIALLTPRGEARGFMALPESPLAAAAGAGYLWVTTAKGRLLKVDPASARVVEAVPLSGGRLSRPSGIAYEPSRMQLWIADADQGRVRIVRLDGTTVQVLTSAGGWPLRHPVDVAFDAATGRAWVLSSDARKSSALSTGEPFVATRFLHVFDLDGRYVTSFGSRDGELSRAGGLAIAGDGRVFVSDTFQGEIAVFDRAGTKRTSIGAFGEDAGKLRNPTGVAFMANGDLAVANTTLGRVDRFGAGAPLPTCAGDSDCDGLPDDWELAHGLNPTWAGDALLDLDGDGLTNLQEYALQTDPRSRDTDGDGYSDGDEVLAGANPTDPNDHRASLAIRAPAATPPGLVRLSAVASGSAACSVSWRQASGPAVSLRSPDAPEASFVARSAGAYEFDARAACGVDSTPPTRVKVEVVNVPPLADAGRLVVAAPGAAVRLDGAASTDANGGLLQFTWDQLVGPPVAPATAGSALLVRPRSAGFYTFQVTATDARGASGLAEVPVLVAAGTVPTAIAAAFPAEPRAGTLVALDASASLVDGSQVLYAWSQVSGPQVTLSGASGAVAAFEPPVAGRYVFEVAVVADGVRGPPGRVEVFVAGDRPLPTVTATAAASVVAVDTPVRLEATGSLDGLGYRWTQVSGPAAGLTETDGAVATAVPFAPGFHVFEVAAIDGDAVSRPVRVAFEARAGGKAIPVARAGTPGLPPVPGQLVFLDGRQSTAAVRFRWTQVEGPWVVLSSGQTSVATFRAGAPGRYVFELEVDDGAVRSAPARVEVNVSAEVLQ